MKIDILAVGIHPDDVELSAVGTLLKHKAMGYSIGLCDLTGGELGTRGSKKLRLVEAENSANIMGADVRVNLHMQDGFFQPTKENTIKLARVIREYQPDIVLANAISDRHPDHGRASKFINDTCFYSGLKKIEILSEVDGRLLDAWRPKAVYNYIQDRDLKPDFVVDITPYMEKKMECIKAFSSQFFSGEEDEDQTPISSKNFMDFMYAKNKVFARPIQAEYAEAFNVSRVLGVDNLFDLR